jgi:hypothetical protein
MIEVVRSVLYDYDDLGHVFEATLMLLVLGPLLAWAWLRLSRRAFWIYPVVVFAWYHGREKAQYELALKSRRKLKSVTPLWNEGWWPGEWPRDAQLDLLVPSLYALAWAVILSLLFTRYARRRAHRRRHPTTR